MRTLHLTTNLPKGVFVSGQGGLVRAELPWKSPAFKKDKELNQTRGGNISEGLGTAPRFMKGEEKPFREKEGYLHSLL